MGYATITINLSEVYKLTEVTEPVIGFGAKLAQAFRTGSTGFVDGLQGFLLGVARGWIGWLIFLVIVVVVILVVRKIRRKRAAAYARQPAPAPGPAWQAPPQAPQVPQTAPEDDKP